MLSTPVIVFSLFSRGLAINLDVSLGEAPSRKTDTVTVSYTHLTLPTKA